MSHLPERLVIVNAGPAVEDPGTGNWSPGSEVPTSWWGLVQQRFVDTQQKELQDGNSVSEYVALFEPHEPGVEGLPPLSRSSWLLGPDGVRYEIVGLPRVRRPPTGPRRPRYVVAYVNAASDIQEIP